MIGIRLGLETGTVVVVGTIGGLFLWGTCRIWRGNVGGGPGGMVVSMLFGRPSVSSNLGLLSPIL
jgi:hypothetical protein